MSKTKKLLRFIVSVLILPFMILVMAFIALVEYLSKEPNWDFYRYFIGGYIDALTFK